VALINHRTHEIHFKIVYYGPGLCGKTTNLKSLHDRLPPERRGRMISIATDQERTLFFDFLPIDLGTVNGFLTRFHLYTVPGQVYYKLSRRAVLQGVDGLVFVADSHPARETANRESLADLNEHLRTLGLTGPSLARIPWVFQYNKRDVPVAIPIERLKKALNPQSWPEYEAVASEGKGVSETLRAACKAVLARLSGTNAQGSSAATPAAAPAATHSASAPATRQSVPAQASAQVAASGVATAEAAQPDGAAQPAAAARPATPAKPAAAAQPGIPPVPVTSERVSRAAAAAAAQFAAATVVAPVPPAIAGPRKPDAAAPRPSTAAEPRPPATAAPRPSTAAEPRPPATGPRPAAAPPSTESKQRP
jgi:signal recognition particle receptor subunit beta